MVFVYLLVSSTKIAHVRLCALSLVVQAIVQRLLFLSSEILTVKQRIAQESEGGLQVGTLEYAVMQLEDYSNDLENRVVKRFDEAAAAADMSAMKECAFIMSELKRETALAQVKLILFARHNPPETASTC